MNKESINTQAWTWGNDAACAGAPEQDVSAFTTPMRTLTPDLVKRYCKGCPVLAQCRNWAETDEYFTGTAGGRYYGEEYRKAQKAGRDAERLNRAVTVAERMYEEWKA